MKFETLSCFKEKAKRPYNIKVKKGGLKNVQAKKGFGLC